MEPRGLAVFLASQEWSNLADLHRKGKHWFFRGFSPTSEGPSTQWRYDLEGKSKDKDYVIDIHVAVPAPRNAQVLWPINGPRKAPKESSSEVARTAGDTDTRGMDVDAEGTETSGAPAHVPLQRVVAGEKASSTESKSDPDRDRSPRRHSVKSVPDTQLDSNSQDRGTATDLPPVQEG